jgi:hypothetical protein
MWGIYMGKFEIKICETKPCAMEQIEGICPFTY